MAGQLREVGFDVSMRVTEDRAQYADKVRRKEIGDLCVFDSSPLSTCRVLLEKTSSRYKGAWCQGYSNSGVADRLGEWRPTRDGCAIPA